jgi:HK97 family phage major capsid protein
VGANNPHLFNFLENNMTTQIILDAIKESLKKDTKVTINLKEASALTGSGSGVGGRVIYDDAFASLRYANPLRMAGIREVTTIGSDEAFVVKTGNVTNPTNPWGYTFTPNVGTPNTATSFWQLPVRVVSAQVPVRTAVLSDINYLQQTLITDIGLEFSQIEGKSMIQNNDQAGTSTTAYGGTDGLRGLDYYPSGSTAAFGSNGSAITNGLHTVLTNSSATGGAISYNDIAGLNASLPPQYYSLPTTAWMMHPATIAYLRELKDSSGLPLFLEIGQKDGSSVGNIFGHKVIPNPYMDQIGSGTMPVYLAAWENFMTVADHEEMSFQFFDQTAPGFLTMYAEKRVCSTIRDVFAGVRLTT